MSISSLKRKNLIEEDAGIPRVAIHLKGCVHRTIEKENSSQDVGGRSGTAKDENRCAQEYHWKKRLLFLLDFSDRKETGRWGKGEGKMNRSQQLFKAVLHSMRNEL